MKRDKKYHNRQERTPVDTNKILWCPFCNWHQADSFASRKRMGSHVGDDHYDEVAFPKGVEPEMIG